MEELNLNTGKSCILFVDGPNFFTAEKITKKRFDLLKILEQLNGKYSFIYTRFYVKQKQRKDLFYWFLKNKIKADLVETIDVDCDAKIIEDINQFAPNFGGIALISGDGDFVKTLVDYKHRYPQKDIDVFAAPRTLCNEYRRFAFVHNLHAFTNNDLSKVRSKQPFKALLSK